MGDRVGPVGTGETSAASFGPPAAAQRPSPVNWSMGLDRQEALVSAHASIGAVERGCEAVLC